MTRKDYVAIAAALAARPILAELQGRNPKGCEGYNQARANIAREIADYCAADPRFDRARFLKACGTTI